MVFPGSLPKILGAKVQQSLSVDIQVNTYNVEPFVCAKEFPLFSANLADLALQDEEVIDHH